MYPFDYHRPEDLDAAARLLAEDPSASLLAGGMTLLPTLKLRLARPGGLIDISGIDALHGIGVDQGRLTIGAATCHADVADSAAVRDFCPALAALARRIGDPQVRNRGTIGGSLANNDPAADYPAAVLAMAATVVTERREIAADEFFPALFETALEPGEIIASVRFPRPERAAYAKFPHPASRYAMCGVFVAIFSGRVRVAVTGTGSGVFRQRAMEAALEREFSPKALEAVVVDPDDFDDDLHASAAYRAQLVRVMARRAVAAANG